MHLPPSLHALEATDKHAFQRRARALQSLWRERQGYACGEHQSRAGARPLGSRLQMPWAEETLANFISEEARAVVRAEVLDAARSAGKLYGKPRIFNDLLSSQPLCFNLFGPLQGALGLASALIADLTGGRFVAVRAVDFELSPGRGDPRYTGDRSAFDVFLTCEAANGGRGFVAIEVKYHEDLAGPPATHRDRYDELAAQMGCFRPEALPALRAAPLQQLWRDHLLAGATHRVDGWDDGLFVVLAPRGNAACAAAVSAYQATLSDPSGFAAWRLEEVLTQLIARTDAAWPRLLWERYCDFDALDAYMAAHEAQAAAGAPR